MSRRPRGLVGPYAPPAPRRELTVTSADGSRIHAEVHGPDGAPAVVLVHGWTCSTVFWAAVLRQLSAEHRVIVYDQRGHGRSPAAGRDGCSTRALADDLVAVVKATLEPGERAVLAGHSMGGMTLMAAADRPELREHAAALLLCSTGSSRLVEVCTVWPLPEGRIRTALTRLLVIARAALGPVTPLARLSVRYVTMGRRATPLMVEAGTRIVYACPRGVRADWGRVLATLDLDAEVARLDVPTLVMQGTDDRLTPIRHAREIAARLPECVGLTELPGLGHMTPIEDPAAISGGIRDLVTRYLTADGNPERARDQVPRQPAARNTRHTAQHTAQNPAQSTVQHTAQHTDEPKERTA